MNKLILSGLALTILGLSACSSEPTAPETTADAAKPVAQATEAVKKNSKKTELVDIKPDAKAAASSAAAARGDINAPLYTSLNAATAAQNTDQIKQVSLDILQNNPKDVRGLNALAMTYYKKGLYNSAEYLLNKAITVEPKVASSYSNLGLVLLARDEKREAIEAFKKALDYDSDHLAASENLGALYISAKQYDKAAEVLGRVAEQSLLSSGSRLNYAVALTGAGQIDQAVAAYEKLLKQDSTNKQALTNLAIIKIEKQSKFEEGLDLVNRLKFVDSDFGSQDLIKALENKAKAGLK